MTNYRPIALLNSLYKLFAATLKDRIAAKLEHHLYFTQFGFRKRRGTMDATHIIRRIMEKGESTKTNTLLRGTQHQHRHAE